MEPRDAKLVCCDGGGVTWGGKLEIRKNKNAAGLELYQLVVQ